ncbi:MAG: DegT/DnrJ/EryC1/StrS family aminotransferase [Desulfovibrionaceae bacterium]
MTIPFIDLKTQIARVRDDLDRRMAAVVEHGQFILGPEVKALESELAGFSGRSRAIGVSSGSDALLLALMALGVGPGDAVLVPAFTFVAPAEMAVLLGATPVFVDVDPVTFNMDPASAEQAVSELKKRPELRLKAIIAVDLFGVPAEFPRLAELAKEAGAALIEDAAQSFGAERFGRKSCSFGDISCTSFFPAKPLGCLGDGGMCFTDDEEIEAKIRSLLFHGCGEIRYEHVRIGVNGRLDTLQAAALQAKMTIFPDEIEKRNLVADRYRELLAGVKDLIAPQPPEGCTSVWAQYCVLSRDAAHRKALFAALDKEKIPHAIHYPMPLHQQPAYKQYADGPGQFPASESLCERIFALPMHPYLKEEDQARIAQALKNA